MTETVIVFTCLNCFWQGWAEELVFNESNGKYELCPQCEGAEFTDDEEEIE